MPIKPLTGIIVSWSLFAGTHMIQSHPPNRKKIIEWYGDEGKYLGAYSAISFVTFLPARRSSPPVVMSSAKVAASFALSTVGAGIMALGISSYKPPEPKTLNKNGEGNKTQIPIKQEEHAFGVQKITRHPMFGGLGVIGLGQLITAVGLAEAVFWAAFPLFFVVGCYHQDYRKLLEGASKQFYKETSLLPFQAIVEGRNKLKVDELKWFPGTAISTGTISAFYLLKFFRR